MPEPGVEERFEFGDNWLRFLDTVDEEVIASSIRDIQSMLHVDSLDGLSFLDAGCGSGLSSLAAARLGAVRILSFDYDPASVAATAALRDRFAAEERGWTVGRGDVTDSSYMAGLGTFDVVYSWGVLHHTGKMWQGLENVVACVAAGGRLFVAIYNDQGRKSSLWRAVKRTYNRAPGPLRAPYAVAVMLPFELRRLVSTSLRAGPREYFAEWRRPQARGMSRWHDLIDWVGGYPFEVAKPEAIFKFCRDRGLELEELVTHGGDLGCNQFVFRKPAG